MLLRHRRDLIKAHSTVGVKPINNRPIITLLPVAVADMITQNRGSGRSPRDKAARDEVARKRQIARIQSARLTFTRLSLGLFLVGLCANCAGDRFAGGGDRPNPQAKSISSTAEVQSAPSGDSGDALKSERYSRRALAYFSEIAFGSEFSQNAPVRRVRKWTKNLRISVQGQPTRQDRRTLERIVGELNGLIDRDGIQLDFTETSPNVVILFAPHGDFINHEPSYVPGNLGFFYTWWNNDMQLVRSRILISSDRITQKERNHLIREELTQSMGLMNDAWTYQNSTFYQGWTRTQNYSELDRDLIRILYDPRVKPGQTPSQVRQALRSK
ncbi:MAG: DUF2927 domain-containing protein [Cyanobacteria bacterium P01_D01_bin.73]